MTKLQFLASLREKLSDLPPSEADERLRFYGEMIDDHVEEGLSEEEAVAAVGSIDEIAAHLAEEAPAVQVSAPKKRLKVWETVLLILGAPVWLSLLIAAAAVLFSLYVSVWAVLISMWAVFASLTATAFGCAAGGIVFCAEGYGFTGAATIAAGLVCAGLGVFSFFGCKAATKGVWLLTTKIILWAKKRFGKKEGAQ